MGLQAFSGITVSITGLFCFWRLGTGIVSGSLNEQTFLSNSKKSGAFLFLFDFEVVRVTVEEAAEVTAIEEAVEVFGVAGVTDLFRHEFSSVIA